MSAEKEKTSSEPTAEASNSGGRRRFVKGAAMVAPAIMTLRSGAAMAAADSSERCILVDRQVAAADQPPSAVNAAGAATDTWVRKPVPLGYRGVNAPGPTAVFFYQQPSGAIGPSQDLWFQVNDDPTNSAQSAFDAGGAASVDLSGVGNGFAFRYPGAAGAAHTTNTAAAEEGFVIVQVDTIGSVTAFGRVAPNQFFNITESCWCSANVNNPDP